MKKHLLSILAASALAATASAQVVLENSGASGISQNSASGSLTGFDVNASSNLLIAVVQGRDLDADGSVSGVTFNSGAQSFTNYRTDLVGTQGLSSIWVLANPTAATGTDISFSVANEADSNYWVSVYSLSNADTNTGEWLVQNTSGPTSDSETLSVTLNSVAAGSFIFDSFVANQGNDTTISGATRDGTVIQDRWNTNTPNNARVSIFGTYIDDASGNYTLSGNLNRIPTGTDGLLTGVAVTAIPEPGTFALFAGALGLALALRRRRRA